MNFKSKRADASFFTANESANEKANKSAMHHQNFDSYYNFLFFNLNFLFLF